ILFHIASVMAFFFKWRVDFLFFDLDPFKNALLFGIAAFLTFLPLFLTSTDWAIRRLGYNRWKSLHRLIYFAFLFSVLHFARINPALLQNPAGYLLLTVTGVALLLELASFVKKVRSGQAGVGALVGAVVTLLFVVFFSLAFFFKR
ncbi:MAG TPA: ferric reductase-like transmembrane domain-containing protein, partial [Candidatus Norongarragalinales archaeon]|nr:ferric reductase-like transmembrane domain-containing protein [Candidatus Norongarragalinales archaeon]